MSNRSLSLRISRVLAPLVAVALSVGAARGQPPVTAQHLPLSLHGDSLGDGGPALQARLVTPVGLARDANGNIYIAERGAHRIRRVDGRTGIITTIAGTGEAGFAGDGGQAKAARFTQPDGLVIDRDGNLLIADPFNHRIRKLDLATGVITTIAGTGEAGFSGDGGPATQARLDGPFGIALDRNGVLYIADTENHRIRRVDPATSRISTVAGNGEWNFAGDGGPATAASFARPHLVVADGDSALLIGDSFNFRIRQLNLRSGIIRTIAGVGVRGSGGDGGPATDAAITYMGGIAVTPNGDVLVSSLAEHRIRRIDRRTGIIHPFAGTGRWSFDGDGKAATATTFHLPLAMVVEPSGSILFTDMWNGRVRRIDANSGVVTTVAGSAESPRTPAVGWHFHYHRDSLRAVLDEPVRYGVDGVAAARVRRDVAYRTDGSRFSRLDVYAPPDAGPPRPAVVLVPGRNDTEVRLKDTGGFASWARLIAASGLVAIVIDHSLGTPARSVARAGDDLVAALDHVRRHASSLQVDTSRLCVMAFASAAPLLTRVLSPGARAPQCVVAQYPHVDLTRSDAWPWVLETAETRARYSLAPVLAASRVPTLLVRAARDPVAINAPLDSLRVRLANRDGFSVLEHPAGSTGFERTQDDSATRAVVRGTLCFLQRSARVPGTQCGESRANSSATTDTTGDGGPATDAFLDRPISLALDASENIYVSEHRAHRVRRIDARTGVIATVAGIGVPGSTGDDGPASRAAVNYPKIALDRAGNLYIGEVNGYRIRRVDARSGIIRTIAGTGEQGFSGDGGIATRARITRPFGLVVDDSGHLYFTDTEANRVRRVDAHTGVITTVAGSGRYEFSGDGGPATAASLARPHVVTLDPRGNLIIGDSFNQRVRRVDRRTGIITTIAGAGYRGASGDGGPATAATFVYFGGLAYDTAGNLLVSGIGDHRIRRVDMRTGVIRPFAGSGRWESGGDGGSALDASFHPALELAVNARNDVFVADAYGGRVRKIDGLSGIVTTVAGSRAPSPQPGDFHVHFDGTVLANALNAPVVPIARDGAASESVPIREGLDYTGTGDPRRQLDIYKPGPSRPTRPGVVVLVHGSAGTDLPRLATRWGAWTSRGRLLAASGFAAVTFSHRLNQEGGLEKAADDLTTALAFIRARAGDLEVDPDRICVVAYADGAPLLTALMRRAVPGVRCVAAISPVVDLLAGPAPFWLDSTAAVRARFTFKSSLDAARRSPPTLLVLGTRSPDALTAAVRDFRNVARAGGHDVDIQEHRDGGLDFDRGSSTPETERVLREWIAFLRRWLS